jgi:hypothetical protein
VRSLECDSSVLEDLAWWIEQDRPQGLRIIRVVREIQRELFSGLGKPEPLNPRSLWLLVQTHQSRAQAGGGSAHYAEFTFRFLNRKSSSPAAEGSIHLLIPKRLFPVAAR